MDTTAIAAYGLALALTLALASRLTPRGWWRRPNLRALAVLGGGTLALGALFAALLVPLIVPRFATLFGPLPESGIGNGNAAAPAALAAAPDTPLATHPARGVAYLVIDDLNLRTENGVRGERIAVLAAGSRVTATGAVEGDWWRVRAQVDGRAREGWASSLWLRRADERRRR